MNADFDGWKDRVLHGLLFGVAATAVGFAGWTGTAIFDRPSRAEIQQMQKVIERNTDAINALRLELAKAAR